MVHEERGDLDVRILIHDARFDLVRVHLVAVLLLRLTQRFLEAGVWVRPLGRVIYLTPALIASDDDIARLTGAIGAALRA